MTEPPRRGWVAVALEGLADLLFVPSCTACGRAAAVREEPFCSACREAVRSIAEPLCSRCGVPFEGTRGPSHVCGACRRRPPPFRSLRSLARYEGPVEEAVQALKYRERLWVAGPLGERLGRLALDQAFPWDAVLPVPLHRDRLAERGFNQAVLLGRPVARALGVPLLLRAIERRRSTPSQTGLSRRERTANVAGAFRVARPWEVWRRALLVVDDVATTGATLGACARALSKAGARSVSALTVARAV